MPSYTLSTLFVALAILPPVLGWAWLNLDVAAPLGIWLAVACMVIVVATRGQRRGLR